MPIAVSEVGPSEIFLPVSAEPRTIPLLRGSTQVDRGSGLRREGFAFQGL